MLDQGVSNGKVITFYVFAACLWLLRGSLRAIHGPVAVRGDTGWVAETVNNVIESKREPLTLKERIEQLAVPEWKAVRTIILILLFSFVASEILYWWNPPVLRIAENDLVNAYTALWQVQTGIAAVALPILLFIIELAKDQRQAATKSHEVLIRETGIFPITVFALGGVVRIGADIAWFGKEAVFLFDLIGIVFLTIALTVTAYLFALRLIFSPSQMHARALVLVKHKMRMSLDASIEVRLANNLLFAKLKELNIGYFPVTTDILEDERYLVLRVPKRGVLCDINLRLLEEFVRSLPWKREQSPPEFGSQFSEDTESPPSDNVAEKESIWVMKRYGQRIRPGNEGFLRLEKSGFTDLDASSLEERLETIIRIEGGYEDN